MLGLMGISHADFLFCRSALSWKRRTAKKQTSYSAKHFAMYMM
jgi:hypothetical protein